MESSLIIAIGTNPCNKVTMIEMVSRFIICSDIKIIKDIRGFFYGIP
tara:strand:- start:318 stop:458 length:141 start_codon:yes stop_codon:yes gene_type:complete